MYQYKTKSLVQASLAPSGHETEWAYSTLPDPTHGTITCDLLINNIS